MGLPRCQGLTNHQLREKQAPDYPVLPAGGGIVPYPCKKYHGIFQGLEKPARERSRRCLRDGQPGGQRRCPAPRSAGQRIPNRPMRSDGRRVRGIPERKRHNQLAGLSADYRKLRPLLRALVSGSKAGRVRQPCRRERTTAAGSPKKPARRSGSRRRWNGSMPRAAEFGARATRGAGAVRKAAPVTTPTPYGAWVPSTRILLGCAIWREMYSSGAVRRRGNRRLRAGGAGRNVTRNSCAFFTGSCFLAIIAMRM